MSDLKAAILAASAKHPKPEDRTFQYGTAGFRMKATLLDSVVFRVGLAAALRSSMLGGETVGVMITASHNPPEDNGVKLIDPMGEMLKESWEEHTTRLANASDASVYDLYAEMARGGYHDVTVDGHQRKPGTPHVIFARDTRVTGLSLVAALTDALDAVGAKYTDHKILTTPQLHYLVRCINTQDTPRAYGEPTEEGYYKKLGAAFAKAMNGRKPKGPVMVDCANGVGGIKLKELMKHLPSASQGGIDIEIVCDDVLKPEHLNYECGADYVKTKQRQPPAVTMSPLALCASLDGDADRIVFYYDKGGNHFQLLDGDKIATLCALFLSDLAKAAGLADSVRTGVVQTAYANGASTEYITSKLHLPVVCTPTGVKHLHRAATKFDIGVYFEANGHGTVVFSDHALHQFVHHEPMSPAQKAALGSLQALSELINQTVGDALSDLLLVQVILAHKGHKGWGPQEWDSTYTDMPNLLVRVEVPDRNIFTTTDAERKLVTPKGAQEQINEAVGKYRRGRAFARASGTEDAVRVYAEAESSLEAKDLARRVALVVQNMGASLI